MSLISKWLRYVAVAKKNPKRFDKMTPVSIPSLKFEHTPTQDTYVMANLDGGITFYQYNPQDEVYRDRVVKLKPEHIPPLQKWIRDLYK